MPHLAPMGTADPNHPPRGRVLTRLLTWLAALSLVGLVGCGAMQAQNPDGKLKPVRATAVNGDAHVMLDGHDVVSYFTQSRHAMGNPQIKSRHEGVTFYFASAEHKALFDAAPTKYLPQFGGFCANGIVYGIPWGGDADTWRIVDGRLYIFGGQGSRAAFELDVKANTALAEKYWREEVAGSNSFWQRSKRMVLRVPHYKNGEELSRMVREAQQKKS
jgi:YHS domain-containing protein